MRVSSKKVPGMCASLCASTVSMTQIVCINTHMKTHTLAHKHLDLQLVIVVLAPVKVGADSDFRLF